MIPFSYCHSCCREKLGAKPRPIMQALMMPVLSAQRTFHQFWAHSQHFFGTLATVSDLRHLLGLTCTTLHHLRHFGSLTCDTLHGSLATIPKLVLTRVEWAGVGWGPYRFHGIGRCQSESVTSEAPTLPSAPQMSYGESRATFTLHQPHNGRCFVH